MTSNRASTIAAAAPASAPPKRQAAAAQGRPRPRLRALRLDAAPEAFRGRDDPGRAVAATAERWRSSASRSLGEEARRASSSARSCPCSVPSAREASPRRVRSSSSLCALSPLMRDLCVKDARAADLFRGPRNKYGPDPSLGLQSTQGVRNEQQQPKSRRTGPPAHAGAGRGVRRPLRGDGRLRLRGCEGEAEQRPVQEHQDRSGDHRQDRRRRRDHAQAGARRGRARTPCTP